MIFQCENCGANVLYSPDKGTMYCSYCSSTDSEKKKLTALEGKGQAVMEDFFCAGCAAPLEVTDVTSACRCAHCGNYNILEERVTGEFLPRLILPFKISKKAAQEKLKETFGKKRFLPDSFLSEGYLDKVEGNYVPFFFYDCDCKYYFKGIGTKIKVWTSGETEFTERSNYQIERKMNIDFSRVPVDASNTMDDKAMDLLEPFDYSALEGFQEKFMSGFLSERYNEQEETYRPRAEDKIKNDAKVMMQQSINGYSSVKKEVEKIDMSINEINYTLLPTWQYEYDYNGKQYLFHLNGQTGKLVGEPPVSMKKAVSFSAATFGLSFLLLAIIRMILEVL